MKVELGTIIQTENIRKNKAYQRQWCASLKHSKCFHPLIINILYEKDWSFLQMFGVILHNPYRVTSANICTKVLKAIKMSFYTFLFECFFIVQ